MTTLNQLTDQLIDEWLQHPQGYTPPQEEAWLRNALARFAREAIDACVPAINRERHPINKDYDSYLEARGWNEARDTMLARKKAFLSGNKKKI